MQHTTPKQCKLLGATVRDVGVIVAVSSTLTYGYAIVEGTDRVNHRVAFADLKRDEVVRVSYGTWDMGCSSLNWSSCQTLPTTPRSD